MIQDILREIKRQSLHVYQVAVYTEQGLETAQVQDAGSCQPIYSITKVFVNTCIGMLADVKSIRLDDNLLPYLQPYIRQDYPDVWNAVTIRQALAHRMGLDDGIFDIDRDDPRAYPTQDYLAYILQYPPKFQPGTHRKYTDCAHYLLSLLLETVQKSAAAAAMPADCMDKMPRQSYHWRNGRLHAGGGRRKAGLAVCQSGKICWAADTLSGLGTANGTRAI